MIKERIMQFLNAEGLSPSQFSEVLGIQRSSISHILSGRNKPSYDFFQKLVDKYPNINLEWFFNGKGIMHKENASTEISINEEYNHATEKKPVQYTATPEQAINTNVNNLKKVLLLFTDGTFESFGSKA